MTLMVRDEADIVGAMVQHHLDQGIDLFLVTDNGSVDGTTEILEQFAARGQIELSHDPLHAKQQHAVVTRMSREAARRGATWVLNADADEFWLSVDPALTVAEELALIDPAVGAFEVPVIDMTGAPARAGTGLQRLTFKDLRPDEEMHALGIHAHATPDVAFVAREDVVVAQGNHFVNVDDREQLPPGRGLVVHHFPWRSWSQFARKVENAGRAYERSPDLRPSANHHGMRDYRRLRDGYLEASYLARHPDEAALSEGISRGWFVADDRIASTTLSPVPDTDWDPDDLEWKRALWSALRPVERRLAALETSDRRNADDLAFERRHVQELDELVARLNASLGEAAAREQALAAENAGLASAAAELAGLHRSRIVRCALVIRTTWRYFAARARAVRRSLLRLR